MEKITVNEHVITGKPINYETDMEFYSAMWEHFGILPHEMHIKEAILNEVNANAIPTYSEIFEAATNAYIKLGAGNITPALSAVQVVDSIIDYTKILLDKATNKKEVIELYGSEFGEYILHDLVEALIQLELNTIANEKNISLASTRMQNLEKLLNTPLGKV